jgi:hypothetical protein
LVGLFLKFLVMKKNEWDEWELIIVIVTRFNDEYSRFAAPKYKGLLVYNTNEWPSYILEAVRMFNFVYTHSNNYSL